MKNRPAAALISSAILIALATLLAAAPLLEVAPTAAAARDANQRRGCADKPSLKMKMNLISSNIANINTTRTPDGGTYLTIVDIDCARTEAALKQKYA